uniref:ribosomal RNA small subunit methyltransferase B n=1 Tax=Erigeron canadensis TaxID=72917 RepID=UPI001CB88EA6|nr:ribosomal RNA small subunit methyltransferase B [Erigeron canadensis]
MEANSKQLPLPDAFLQFLKENEIDPSIYYTSNSHFTPRYVRLKPGCEDQLEAIEAEIKCKLEKVEWLPGFYSLPPDIQIASSKAYQEGKMYGIDAASGAAVSALNISPGDHVLDLCAAPGAKLCMVLEILGNSGSVTGVDVARHRLAACRNLIQKYSLGDHCRLFVADGVSFSLIPIRVHSEFTSLDNREFDMDGDDVLYKEWTSRRPWKERKKAVKEREKGSMQLIQHNQDPEMIYYGRHSGVVGLSKSKLFQIVSSHDISRNGYDKVLVDAECTHDGSIKHIQKFDNWGWSTLERRVLDADRTDDLTVLQFGLLTNGFKLLKVGGYLVYSTCSLTSAQNEDVVEKFLSLNVSAELVEIDGSKSWPCKSGRIPKTLRFDPLTSRTSGLFVAKFTKLAM